MSIIASHSPLISRKPLEIEAWFQTPKDYQQEMAHVESNNHVIYDLTRPWKVKVTTSNMLGPNISKTAGDAIN